MRWIFEGKSASKFIAATSSRRRFFFSVSVPLQRNRKKERKERETTATPISTVQIIQECRVPMEL